jgi:hypothetical protein
MAEMVVLGAAPLSIEDVVRVARGGAEVRLTSGARTRIAKGRARLEELLARGERIYGVNTGVGGNVGISLAPARLAISEWVTFCRRAISFSRFGQDVLNLPFFDPDAREPQDGSQVFWRSRNKRFEFRR